MPGSTPLGIGWTVRHRGVGGVGERDRCRDDAECRPTGRLRYYASLLLVALLVVALWALLAVAAWAVRGAAIDDAPTPQGPVGRSVPSDASGGGIWIRPPALGTPG